jgi:hypothetical protein
MERLDAVPLLDFEIGEDFVVLERKQNFCINRKTKMGAVQYSMF